MTHRLPQAVDFIPVAAPEERIHQELVGEGLVLEALTPLVELLLALARQWLDETIASASPAWVCARCGERHEPHFASCWKCGADSDVA